MPNDYINPEDGLLWCGRPLRMRKGAACGGRSGAQTTATAC